MNNFTNDKNITEVHLSANPDSYDYFHEIVFTADGKVIIADGDCQSVYGHIEGNFEVETIEENKIKIKFFNLTLFDPYNHNIVFSKIDSMECITHKIKVDFKFTPAYDKEEYLYNICYQFTIDPLTIFRKNCLKYSSKYIPELDENSLKIYKNSSENYASNGIYFNELETKYYLSSDIRKL